MADNAELAEARRVVLGGVEILMSRHVCTTGLEITAHSSDNVQASYKFRGTLVLLAGPSIAGGAESGRIGW